MEVHFTPEQEVRLLKIATHEGIDPAQLVKEAALRLLEDDTRFRNAVRQASNRLTRAS
jgi:DNA-directed RNA polymerase subunit L